MSIYADIILDHYRNPKNRGKIGKPTASVSAFNPLCGDKIQLDILVKNGKIAEIKFTGQGCAISQASASMLTNYVVGKDKKNLRNLDKEFMIDLVGIELGPTRLKCLLLSLEALHKALNGRK